jgi:hypothetical protein
MRDRDGFGRFVKDVNDPVVTNPNSPLVFIASEFLAAWRSWVLGKRQNLCVYTGKQPVVERRPVLFAPSS